jgi:hypothetical protein
MTRLDTSRPTFNLSYFGGLLLLCLAAYVARWNLTRKAKLALYEKAKPSSVPVSVNNFPTRL